MHTLHTLPCFCEVFPIIVGGHVDVLHYFTNKFQHLNDFQRNYPSENMLPFHSAV